MAFRLLNKTQMNFAYGMGASIVIIGALMKITHFQAGFLTGNLMLTIGLITEAIIFALSAFDPPAEDLNWAKVYPELDDEDGPGPGRKETPQGLLTKKLDAFYKSLGVAVTAYWVFKMAKHGALYRQTAHCQLRVVDRLIGELALRRLERHTAAQRAVLNLQIKAVGL